MSQEVHSAPQESKLNKYEMVIVAAKEARRLNEAARQQGREIRGRITDVALLRYLKGEIKYRYND